MPVNPLDTTTTPSAGLLQRIQRLEERLEALERTRISQVAYFKGPKAAVEARLAELAAAPNGTIIAVLKELPSSGVETVLYVKFPEGWQEF